MLKETYFASKIEVIGLIDYRVCLQQQQKKFFVNMSF